MKKLIAILVLVGILAVASDSDAAIRRRRIRCVGGSCSVATVTTSVSVAACETPASEWYPLALARARAQAERYAVGHWLGCPAGCYEGAGCGPTESAAITNCCFWGQRTPRAIAVAQRGAMWFACVLYH